MLFGKDNMAKHKEIYNSINSKHGDGLCTNCHKKIEGLYMVTHYYDMSSRGNENDRISIRCEKCISPDDKIWKQYLQDKDIEEQKIKAEKNDPYYFIKIVAGNCEYESEYDGRTYSYCFYCDNNIGDGDKHSEYCPHIYAQKILEEKGI